MARPKKEEQSHALNIRVNGELLQKIERASEALKAEGLALSLAAVVRHLIEKGLKEVEAKK